MNDILSVIFVLVTEVHGGETVKKNGMTMNNIGKRAHVLNNSYGRCVFGAFDKILHEGYIWTRPRAVIYFFLHKSTFLHIVHHGTKIYYKYINIDNRKNYIDDYGSGIFSKTEG